uniref:ABC transporter ATP-binding protein n=1 Tax=Actinomyces sp. TaxID=29317 RepID=UPI0028A1EDEE
DQRSGDPGALPDPGGTGPIALTWAETLRRLRAILHPIRFLLLGGLLCASTGSVLALMIPQVLQHLINTTLQQDPSRSAVATAAALVLGLGAFESALVYLRRVLVVAPATDIERDMRVGLFDHLLHLPVAFHDAWGSGQLLSRSMTDLSQVRRWIAFGMIMLVTDIVTITVGTLLMVRASAQLALVFAVAAVPIVAISYRFARRYHVLSRASQERAGDLATTVEQSVQGIRVLKAFGRGGYALRGFTGQAFRLRDVEVSKATATGVFDLAMIALPETVLGAALFIGLHQVADGRITVGALAAYFTTATMVTGPVRMLGQHFAQAVNSKTALDRHWEVLDAPLTITDPPDPRTLPGDTRTPGAGPGVPGGHHATADDSGGHHDFPAPLELTFHDVHFRYPDAPDHVRAVLRGVTLTVRPGETLALVGVTGSGKSTLLDLVPRLHDVTAGSVTLDGTDVRDLRLTELRRVCAMTFEDPNLFSASVRDNVLLGVDPHTDAHERERLLRLALDTAAADFVEDLPDGVDTPIGEEGLSLSGGQRQRLALARAIAARPRVLLLDDPLSALDTRTEEQVTHHLREVLRGTTTLVVAHRPSTVDLADRVALLDDGVIAGVGTHHELLARSPRYRYVIANLEEGVE